MIESNERGRERAVLVSIDTGEFDVDISLAELQELADTAGAVTVATMIQRRESTDKATAIGAGRLKELAELCGNQAIDLVIFDVELNATQHRNLEDALPCRVIDRTALILDIFAQRAVSAEGRLQVELAQLQYRLPRLAGMGKDLSRLGGGIGTRGPGETKLETDRRHIRRRIQTLQRKAVAIKQQRTTRRERRSKDGIATVAIVGYTNAGKSTLMNALTDAGVLAEDKLFATLDTTSRALRMPDGRQVLLIDTVGFVRRLPHQLVDAFRSTLEEAVSADVIVHLCDASDQFVNEQCEVTRQLLQELGCEDRPILTVMNKCDLLDQPLPLIMPGTICISAAKKQGFDNLLKAIADALPPDRKKVSLLLPFCEGALAQACRTDGAVEFEEYVPEGLKMTVTLGMRMLDAVKDYIVE